MKIIRFILIGLIIIGVGLLLSQRFWLPSLITAILSHDESVQPTDGLVATSTTPETPRGSMANWNWVYSDVSAQGTQFLYPNPLPTKFVTAQGWPPSVVMTNEDFVCVEGEAVEADGLKKRYERHTIGDRVYCVGVVGEAAAGTTFTSYDYVIKEGDFLTRVTFTLRTPQCLNYDQPEQSACLAEQAGFDVDGLVDRMVSSIKMQ